MRHFVYTLPLTFGALCSVQAAEINTDFMVRDIQIEGLVRLPPASVYALLPISRGQTVTDVTLNASIQALYESGNFDDIQASKQGNTLTFKVIERPVISSITFKGNKLIPEETLKKGFKSIGLTEGSVLKRSTLQNIQSELESQYAQQGRYDAEVSIQTTPRPNNRVDVKFNFIEGTPARVVDIRVLGNTVFSEKDIRQAFSLRQHSWSSIVTRNDRYARERMAASLENLKALYLNKGYVNFAINNAQLNLTENKKKVFVEVSINEGQQYRFGDVSFLGNTLYDPSELKPLANIKKGDIYSQAKINAVQAQLERKYGNAGYYYAKVRMQPDLDDKNHIANIAYYIDPGKQVYVRRINFIGNAKTEDKVLRREMRQLESSLASTERIDLSKIRLERTGFFKTVRIEVQPVPNTADQVDLNVNVEEQTSGTSSIAVGYSQTGGVTFQFGISQTNFLGTGNQVSIDLSRSQTLDNYNLSVLDPYYTADGISRGFNVYYRKSKLNSLSINNYVSDSYGGSLTLGYPLDENKNISATLNIDNTQIKASPYVAKSIQDYLLAHGAKSAGAALANDPTNMPYNADFLSYNLGLNWTYNTLNRPIFPTTGQSQRVSLDIALPGSKVAYQRITYDGQRLLPLGDLFGLRGYTRLGYGHNLPFFKNYFAGGYGSVRGYKDDTLGPRSPTSESFINGVSNEELQYQEPVGGNALIQGGLELILPVPSKEDWARQIRPVLFVEGGQVFDTTAPNFKISTSDFRYSAGAGFTWITPIGPLSLAYAFPLNHKDGDNEKRIQFQIGRVF